MSFDVKESRDEKGETKRGYRESCGPGSSRVGLTFNRRVGWEEGSKTTSAAHRQVTMGFGSAPRWEDAHENEGQRTGAG